MILPKVKDHYAKRFSICFSCNKIESDRKIFFKTKSERKILFLKNTKLKKKLLNKENLKNNFFFKIACFRAHGQKSQKSGLIPLLGLIQGIYMPNFKKFGQKLREEIGF